MITTKGTGDRAQGTAASLDDDSVACSLLPVPSADLHASIMATPSRTLRSGSGSQAHDDFATLLECYQYNQHRSDGMDDLAAICDRRLTRLSGTLPLDLISAYTALARLARWRAETLRGAR